MSKKDKKGKKPKKEEEPAPDLLGKDGISLVSMINEFREKVTDLRSRRNYVQNERDLLEQFATNTKKENDELKIQLTNKASEAGQLEQDHRVEVKVYLQKVKYLEYDQRLNTQQVNQQGDANLKIEDEYFEQRLKDLQHNKTEMKKQYYKNEDLNQLDVKQTDENHRKMMKTKKDEYEKKLKDMIDKYEDALIKLRNELELKLKVEIHEIEERKNQHLNELMRNHDAAFAELKDYYNEITRENLNLIRSQKQRIEELQSSLIVNGKLITEIKAKNKAMEDPIEKARKLRDDLKYALRQHEKDKMALANLRIKLKSLKEKIAKTEREQDIIDKRYLKAIQDKKDLENRFERVTEEVKMHSDAKNVVLTKKLSELSQLLEAREAHLHYTIQNSQIDPRIIENLNNKIQESIESKNALVKNLQYSIQHASKAYNDAIRVYEAKLIEFGVPADELGFQTLETKTSLMPAGLVSSQ